MEDLKRQFGRLVAAHRKRRSWTQRRLAEVSELSEDMIARVEVGSTGACFDTISKLAAALEVEPAELFHPTAAGGTLAAGQLAELLSQLANLNEGELRWLRRIIEAAISPKT